VFCLNILFRLNILLSVCFLSYDLGVSLLPIRFWLLGVS
jgi:hypothetical protein